MKFNDFHEKSKDPQRGGFRHCGGTILTQRHVLTATHCTKKEDRNGRQVDIIRNGGAIFVVFGLLNWCRAREQLFKNWEGPWANIRAARSVKAAEKYDYQRDAYDIAIIRVRHTYIGT